MANEATIQKKGTHYAWWVMIGYGMLMCATIGAVTVMGGLFYYPVCDELGFNFSTFTIRNNFNSTVYRSNVFWDFKSFRWVNTHYILHINSI